VGVTLAHGDLLAGPLSGRLARLQVPDSHRLVRAARDDDRPGTAGSTPPCTSSPSRKPGCRTPKGGSGCNRAKDGATGSSVQFAGTVLARWDGADQRADRGGPTAAAGTGWRGFPGHVATGPGRTGTQVGAGLGPRGGDLDSHPGHGGRAVSVTGAPARRRRRLRHAGCGAR